MKMFSKLGTLIGVTIAFKRSVSKQDCHAIVLAVIYIPQVELEDYSDDEDEDDVAIPWELLRAITGMAVGHIAFLAGAYHML